MYISVEPTFVTVGNTKFLCPDCKFAAVFQDRRTEISLDSSNPQKKNLKTWGLEVTPPVLPARTKMRL